MLFYTEIGRSVAALYATVTLFALFPQSLHVFYYILVLDRLFFWYLYFLSTIRFILRDIDNCTHFLVQVKTQMWVTLHTNDTFSLKEEGLKNKQC